MLFLQTALSHNFPVKRKKMLPNKKRYEMRWLPLVARQMLFLALLQNPFHIIVSFCTEREEEHMLAHRAPKPLPGKLLFINIDNFSGSQCRNLKLSAANGAHYAKQDWFFFLIHPTHSCNRNEALYFLPASRGWHMIFFSLVSPVKPLSSHSWQIL